jgi:hypothetical protein
MWELVHPFHGSTGPSKYSRDCTRQTMKVPCLVPRSSTSVRVGVTCPLSILCRFSCEGGQHHCHLVANIPEVSRTMTSSRYAMTESFGDVEMYRVDPLQCSEPRVRHS